MPATPLNLFSFRTYSAPALPGTVPFNSYVGFNYDWFWLSYQGENALMAYYANLLIIQYIDQPKAYGQVQALANMAIIDDLPLAVQDAFNLIGPNTALGSQLDVIGKYVGVTRNGYGFFGPITLDDTDFFTFIQMAIIRNNSGSSLATIQKLLNQFFPNQIFVFDYQNMNMSYLINTSVGSQNLIDMFVTEGLLPKPMGVGLSVIAVPVINKFFGLRTYDAVASPITTPLNNYDSYNTAWLFLTYQDAVV